MKNAWRKILKKKEADAVRNVEQIKSALFDNKSNNCDTIF